MKGDLVQRNQNHEVQQLNDGGWIPSIAFGTGTSYFNRGEDVHQGILKAVNVGYELIDTAVMYGTECGVGKAITEITKNLCSYKREDLFITTKLSPKFHKYQTVIDMVDQSLKNLQLESIDLVLIHFPGLPPNFEPKRAKTDQFSNIPLGALEIAEARIEMWEGLQQCQKDGKVKHIGVSNFNRHHIEQLIQNPRCKMAPAVNQIEFNPYMVDQDILSVCQEHKIVVQSYGPLGSGTRNVFVGGEEGKATQAHMLEDPVINAMSGRIGCTPAQLCIAYALAKGIAVVTKTEREARLLENFESTKFVAKLTADDVSMLDGLNRNLRKFWDPYLVE